MGRDVDGSTMGKMMILRKEKNYLLQYIIVLKRLCSEYLQFTLSTSAKKSRPDKILLIPTYLPKSS